MHAKRVIHRDMERQAFAIGAGAIQRAAIRMRHALGRRQDTLQQQRSIVVGAELHAEFGELLQPQCKIGDVSVVGIGHRYLRRKTVRRRDESSLPGMHKKSKRVTKSLLTVVQASVPASCRRHGGLHYLICQKTFVYPLKNQIRRHT